MAWKAQEPVIEHQIRDIQRAGESCLAEPGVLRVSTIEKKIFSGLTSLTTLSLIGSQLSSIEPGNFSGLPALTSLCPIGTTS